MFTAQQTDIQIMPRRSLGGLFAQVIIEEKHEDTLEITEHPVEQGAQISDHAYLKARQVTIRGGVSDSNGQSGAQSAQDFYDLLRELQEKREPFDIVTGKRLYSNMLLESLTVVTDELTEHALVFTAQCREVIIVATQTTTIPPRSSQGQPAKTAETTDRGQQQAQPRQSMLSAAFGGG